MTSLLSRISGIQKLLTLGQKETPTQLKARHMPSFHFHLQELFPPLLAFSVWSQPITFPQRYGPHPAGVSL
jgi:hypothetical protein